ncbi:MAG: AraC family transcriptional regulator [Chloroflexi bacterium]|nr:AraC family transcriptional regulator [Chloroflexota bacterium]
MDGFAGEIMYVVPRPMLQKARSHPLVRPLTPTDIGWFPSARYHYRERPSGAPEHILIFCTEGKGWLEVEGGRYEISANQALIIPKRRPHVYGAVNDDPWSIHWVHFIGAAGDYYVGQLKKGAYSLSIDAGMSASLEDLFARCRDTFVANFLLQRMIYASQTLHHLLGFLFFNNRAFSPLLRSSRFRSIDRTVSYLHENMSEQLTLNDMVDHSGLSKSHFIRLFKDQTGHTPMDYFIQLKMQHACMLLAYGQASVGQIGEELGYHDQYYFSRAFRKVIGMSPTMYRQSSYS